MNTATLDVLNEHRSDSLNTVVSSTPFSAASSVACGVERKFETVCKGALGYGALTQIIDTVETLRLTVDVDTLPPESRRKWAAILRSGSMAAQRSYDPRWFTWFADAWQLALQLEDFGVLHDLCGDISALRPNQVGTQIANLRMRGAIAGFSVANLTADTTHHLKALARNADRLMWVGELSAAEKLLGRNGVRAKIQHADLSRNNHCLVLDTLCALAVATSDLSDALSLANTLKESAFDMPIYQAHAHFHIGMIAVKRFNFGKARECLEALDSLSIELGSVDAAEEMQFVLRTAWDTGRTPKPIYKRENARMPLDAAALHQLSIELDDAVDRHQPWLAKVLPRFNTSAFP